MQFMVFFVLKKYVELPLYVHGWDALEGLGLIEFLWKLFYLFYSGLVANLFFCSNHLFSHHPYHRTFSKLHLQNVDCLDCLDCFFLITFLMLTTWGVIPTPTNSPTLWTLTLCPSVQFYFDINYSSCTDLTYLRALSHKTATISDSRHKPQVATYTSD